MANYGAFLTDQQGNPYYILDTLPLCLIEKKSFNITGGRVISVIHPNDSTFRLVFCRTNVAGSSFSYYLDTVTTGSYVVDSRGAASGFTLDVYVFGYQYQTPPKYGIAIWDSAGRCVITNETKVLRGIEVVGNQADPNASGYNAAATLVGEWAVAPDVMGSFNGVINQGAQVYPIQAIAYTSAYKSGSSTVIKSEFVGDSGSGASNVQFYNRRNTIKAINVSMY
ncbi:hypothetical protein SRABI13_01656 [Erwinia aphidicola]|uniref:hypothetical protein n=1 Tax=Erwinia aphidicola TaxID=68334 RepID=UPI001DE4AB54|nr:hypothetical protein [Erwinia aphidicola]CAH0198100.1 hypothetical protein SRABI13_01656 [Erwinia aphidicola]